MNINKNNRLIKLRFTGKKSEIEKLENCINQQYKLIEKSCVKKNGNSPLYRQYFTFIKK